MARLTTSAPAVRAERPEVSQALDDVIHRCLARQPSARFGSAAAVRDALDRARLDPTGAIPRPVVGPGAAGATGATGVVPAAAGSGVPTGPTHPQPVPVPLAPAPAPRRRRRLTWLWVLLVILVAIGGGVAAFVLVNDRSGSGSGNGNGASSSPSAAGATITAATAFDPLGDGTEDPEHVSNAIDGNATTVWSTDQYQQFPDGAKNGVGLALTLNGEYDVSKVVVDTLQSGWGASIYVSDKPVGSLTSLADWGPVRASGSDLDRSHAFAVRGVKGQSVLLWLTQLPPGDNGQHYVQVAEVKVA
jgi:hypothetical protein